LVEYWVVPWDARKVDALVYLSVALMADLRGASSVACWAAQLAVVRVDQSAVQWVFSRVARLVVRQVDA